MIKTYKTPVCYAVTIPLKSGRKIHVQFKKHSMWGAAYITNDKELQQALDSLGYDVAEETPEDGDSEEPTATTETKEEQKKESLTDENQTYTAVAVNDIEEAKEYLIVNCGVSARYLRSKKAILETAESKGIKFEGI